MMLLLFAVFPHMLARMNCSHELLACLRVYWRGHTAHNVLGAHIHGLIGT